MSTAAFNFPQIDDSGTVTATMRRISYLIHKHAPSLLRMHRPCKISQVIAPRRTVHLNAAQRAEVRQMRAEGFSFYRIAAEMDCSYSQARRATGAEVEARARRAEA